MRLFEPYKIGRIEVKNRIIMAPMVTGRAENGFVSDWHVNYYSRRAEGGCGLIVVEGIGVDPDFCLPFALRLDEDKYIDGMSRLTDSIKNFETKVICQAAHQGKQTSSKYFGRPTLAPSAVPCPVFREDPHVLSIDEIRRLIDMHIQAALRAKKAGFDGVEIHGAHGYLISQFLSPWDNRRSDEYGGDIEGRAKFAVEIVRGIRESLSEFLIFFRISAEQFGDGLHLEEAKKIGRIVEDAGVDALHISAGRYASIHWMIPPMTQPQGCLVPLAAEMRRVARKPVVAVGRIATPELAENILERGDADLIALGRPLFADPDYPRKGKELQGFKIRPCIACNTCFDNLFVGRSVKCTVNPELKHGRSVEVKPGKATKKVLVIGGGPGGMEAALTSAQKGHRVSLWERGSLLGGQLLLAMASPGRSEFKRLIDFYSSEMEELGVEVRLGYNATLERILNESPESLVLATGIIPTYPEIPGLDREQTPTAHDVLAGKINVGNQVVIIGGGHTGCETAKFLAKQGKAVSVLRRGPRMAIEAGWSTRKLLLEELNGLGAVLLTGVHYREIQSQKIKISANGEERVLPFETLVIATGVESNNRLYKELEGKFDQIFLIGDALRPGDASEAIEEARLAAMEI